MKKNIKLWLLISSISIPSCASQICSDDQDKADYKKRLEFMATPESQLDHFINKMNALEMPNELRQQFFGLDCIKKLLANIQKTSQIADKKINQEDNKSEDKNNKG